MQNRLRINWVLPSVGMSGGTKSNRLIAEAMSRRGHDVVMYYQVSSHKWPSIRQPRLLARRIRSELATTGRQRHQLENAAIPIIPLLPEQVAAGEIRDADVTIATWWLTREWIEPLPPSKGIKAYFVRHHELHGGDSRRVAATYRMSGLKLVIAKWLKKVMAEEYGDPDAVLVPNGVIREQFDSVPRDKNDVPVVGFVYAPEGWKAGNLAVDAIAAAQRQRPDLRVVSFGASPMPNTLRRKLKNLLFKVRPPQRDLPAIYTSADAWIVPSDSEGFGMPGIEAAACHCPVIATCCGGPEDYVESGKSGYLVDVRDRPAMTDSILKIIGMSNQEWRPMSARSYSISTEFDWNKSAELLDHALHARIAVENVERRN